MAIYLDKSSNGSFLSVVILITLAFALGRCTGSDSTKDQDAQVPLLHYRLDAASSAATDPKTKHYLDSLWRILEQVEVPQPKVFSQLPTTSLAVKSEDCMDLSDLRVLKEDALCLSGSDLYVLEFSAPDGFDSLEFWVGPIPMGLKIETDAEQINTLDEVWLKLTNGTASVCLQNSSDSSICVTPVLVKANLMQKQQIESEDLDLAYTSLGHYMKFENIPMKFVKVFKRLFYEDRGKIFLHGDLLKHAKLFQSLFPVLIDSPSVQRMEAGRVALRWRVNKGDKSKVLWGKTPHFLSDSIEVERDDDGSFKTELAIDTKDPMIFKIVCYRSVSPHFPLSDQVSALP